MTLSAYTFIYTYNYIFCYKSKRGNYEVVPYKLYMYNTKRYVQSLLQNINVYLHYTTVLEDGILTRSSYSSSKSVV